MRVNPAIVTHSKQQITIPCQSSTLIFRPVITPFPTIRDPSTPNQGQALFRTRTNLGQALFQLRTGTVRANFTSWTADFSSVDRCRQKTYRLELLVQFQLEFPTEFAAKFLDRWPSGLWQRFTKPPKVLALSVGSNPSLSVDLVQFLGPFFRVRLFGSGVGEDFRGSSRGESLN